MPSFVEIAVAGRFPEGSSIGASTARIPITEHRVERVQPAAAVSVLMRSTAGPAVLLASVPHVRQRAAGSVERLANALEKRNV